ncbi:hypothetical protein ALQ08_101553 [Pseudomonas syringae pv. delphinii]|uniref:Uncharacterized protein n=3 Tax=Pseudomonas syringae group genomosp. 3 TaxID=251701 RepID=A0A0P9PXV6_9PSED|nr:hypothetical protein ALO72_101238 [Pseudomonas syringae pv. delphinii]KPZ21659.1 hypothetical protein ALO40_100823 [Pseudomonas syringae pv. viburni]RMR13437.1 hypothetical protein ALP92_101285 [Pseudomonas syringae pv. primulae]RMP06918.1 hypothetical protein ALQ28_101436 [Pseudomonas syringae pv. delphinii]RMP20179.1 hypothetical protein ALQ27_101509 [Pseudomonas syringae pv. delphinii]
MRYARDVRRMGSSVFHAALTMTARYCIGASSEIVVFGHVFKASSGMHYAGVVDLTVV